MSLTFLVVSHECAVFMSETSEKAISCSMLLVDINSQHCNWQELFLESTDSLKYKHYDLFTTPVS